MRRFFYFVLVSLMLFSAAACFAAAAPSAGGHLVCLDPGHEDAPDFGQEPVAPGSAQTKDRVTSGCFGVTTKIPEYELNLENALLLEKILRQDGFGVALTRRNSHVRVSNVERAQFANASGADLAVRLHADWSPDASKRGISILVPDKKLSFAAASTTCAEQLKTALTKAGFVVNSIIERPDLSGFNWSKIPVVLVEVGFMSNSQEDVLMSRPSYRRKLMRAVANGIESYFAPAGR